VLATKEQVWREVRGYGGGGISAGKGGREEEILISITQTKVSD
jgi:hypothetical protein